MTDDPIQLPEKAKSPPQQVMAWLLEGMSEDDIREALATTWPDHKPEPLIVSAFKQLERAGDPDIDLVYGFAIEASRLIYQTAFAAGDLKTALRAIKQVVDLAHQCSP